MSIPQKLSGLVMLSALLLPGGCNQQEASTPGGPRATLVDVAPVERQPITTRRIVTGTLEAASTVAIFNEEAGRLISLPYYEGDQVEQGDILAHIDDSLLRSELDKVTASLNQSRVDLRRIEQLVTRQLASEDELSRIKTAVQQHTAEVELLQNRINRSQIRAPFDGVISHRLREPGDVVPVYTHILTLINPRYLKADIRLSELLVANIQVNQPVSLRIDALGEQEHSAVVTRVHPTIDPATRQGTIEVKLEPVPEGARPGQLARVSIEARTAPRLSIPFPALRHDNSGEYVFRVDEQQRARKVRIQTGIQLANRVEIVQGLEEGDQVVTRGFIGLRDGSVLNIAGAETTAESGPRAASQAGAP